MAESTFIAVEKQNPSGDWTVVATDAHFETMYVISNYYLLHILHYNAMDDTKLIYWRRAIYYPSVLHFTILL